LSGVEREDGSYASKAGDSIDGIGRYSHSTVAGDNPALRCGGARYGATTSVYKHELTADAISSRMCRIAEADRQSILRIPEKAF